MAFFDKLSSVTKNAAAGAGDMIEITKLNAKILSENKKIEGFKDQLGDLYWQKAVAGQELDADAMALIYQMREIVAQVEAYNSEIAAIKAAQSIPPQAAVTLPADSKICHSCGEILGQGVRFCPNCGAAMPQEKHCPACGEKIEDNVKFCPACGSPLA
ncbi:MAG: zinc-ribbon domain-containing protein [Clostridiales bacterium]